MHVDIWILTAFASIIGIGTFFQKRGYRIGHSEGKRIGETEGKRKAIQSGTSRITTKDSITALTDVLYKLQGDLSKNNYQGAKSAALEIQAVIAEVERLADWLKVYALCNSQPEKIKQSMWIIEEKQPMFIDWVFLQHICSSKAIFDPEIIDLGTRLLSSRGNKDETRIG